MSDATLGPRPTPDKISFAPECFRIAGHQTEYYVARAPHYPKVFRDKASADAYAARTGATILTDQRPVFERVRWS